MKAFVFGVGRMGTAISWAMHKLGFELVCADQDEAAHDRWMEGAGLEVAMDVDFYHGKRLEDLDGVHGCLTEANPDVVISSLPYHQTELLAKKCIDNGIRYCDLGGRVDVSQRINCYAKTRATKPIFTDLGLAPGWVNILAEEGYRKLYGSGEVVCVEMMVGGLPDYLDSNKNPLRYGITWSVDGLINEYRDDCIVLENGEIKTVRGMEGLETLDTEKLGPLEAFYTSGGASHTISSMKARGVENCSYKTLRYRGHRDIVRFLIRDCDLDDSTLTQIFCEGCGYVERDEVIIIAKVHKDNKNWVEEKLIKSDGRFSAMQKATAFPVASVAALMAEGVFDGNKDEHRDYHTQYSKALSYEDIPFDRFKENLRVLGLSD